MLLLNTATGEELPAAVRAGGDDLYGHARDQWRAAFAVRQARGLHDEDRLWWDMDVPASAAPRLQEAQAMIVTNDVEVHGVLLFEDVPVVSRKTACPVLYVRYLATAPWNRGGPGVPRFRGVGTRLVDAARRASLHRGCHGCLGLHALPGAESFYARRGLQDFGVDPVHRGLHYFEGCPEPARPAQTE